MPRLKKLVQLGERGCGQVIALTSVDSDSLYVLRYPCKQYIEVYSAETFKLKNKLSIAGLSEHHFNSMTACVNNNCLYISDHKQSDVYNFSLSNPGKLLRWRVRYIPVGLSVNRENNLLVTCYDAGKLLEVKPNGDLIREIDVELGDTTLHVWHAIQLARDRYLVCISTGPFSIGGDVAEVDKRGRVVVSYKDQLHTETRDLLWPCHLVVDEDDGCIFVVDRGSERLTMLKRSLKHSVDLNAPIDADRHCRPWCIYVHKSSRDKSRLFVGNDNEDTSMFEIRRRKR
jgi:hypothetical protein